MTPRILPEADDEMVSAGRQIERGRSGFGFFFLNECAAAVAGIEQAPDLYPLAGDAPVGREVRYVYISPFRYRVLYLVRPDELVVVAFAHASRRPGYWTDRLP